jgi:hypothetical protein
MNEAGSDELSFEEFDAASQQTRDLLSLCEHLYCPEGHVPGTRISIRVITNSRELAPDMVAYLDRAPRKDPPDSLPMTVYALETEEEEAFAGFAIEEIEVRSTLDDVNPDTWVHLFEKEPEFIYEAKSAAAIVCVGKPLDIQLIVGGIEASAKALARDEMEREAKKAQEAAAAEEDD